LLWSHASRLSGARHRNGSVGEEGGRRGQELEGR
jgi:hypothetical protein